MEAATAIAGELRCAGCNRSPLVGEWATLHAGRPRRRGESTPLWLCALCEADDSLSSRYGEQLSKARLQLGASNVLPELDGP